MAIIGFVGESKSGKTSLIVEITEALSGRGYEVATIKHIANPDFTTIDTRGTDTYRHANAGASLVVGASSGETAFILKDRLDFSNVNRSEVKLNIKINKEALPLGKFVKKIIRNTVLGLISSLKDVERVETLEITYEGER